MYDTFELGPHLNMTAQDFLLPDYNQQRHSLEGLMGGNGVLLGFIGDIWRPTSVRRILWLQRHVSKFALLGTPIALLVRDQPHTLFGFQMSSPLPVPFPLLADTDGSVHRAYSMETMPGLLLIDHRCVIRHKWLMTDDEIWPKMAELVETAQTLQAFA
jgi:peroxiredoxin